MLSTLDEPDTEMMRKIAELESDGKPLSLQQRREKRAICKWCDEHIAAFVRVSMTGEQLREATSCASGDADNCVDARAASPAMDGGAVTAAQSSRVVVSGLTQASSPPIDDVAMQRAHAVATNASLRGGIRSPLSRPRTAATPTAQATRHPTRSLQVGEDAVDAAAATALQPSSRLSSPRVQLPQAAPTAASATATKTVTSAVIAATFTSADADVGPTASRLRSMNVQPVILVGDHAGDAAAPDAHVTVASQAVTAAPQGASVVPVEAAGGAGAAVVGAASLAASPTTALVPVAATAAVASSISAAAAALQATDVPPRRSGRKRFLCTEMDMSAVARTPWASIDSLRQLA